MHKEKFYVFILMLLFPTVGLAASCTMSNKKGFHLYGNNLCLSTLNYIDSIASQKQLNINSFRILDNKTVIFAANAKAGSFLMLATPNRIVKILAEIPNKDVKKNIESIRQVDVFLIKKDIYFLSSAWATSGAIHKITWNKIINAVNNIPITIDDIKFVKNGNSFYIIQSGKYQGYIIANKHKYRAGGGSYDIYVLVSPLGKEIKEIGLEKQSVNNFLSLSESDETL